MVDVAFTYSLSKKRQVQYFFTVGCLYFSWLIIPGVFLVGYYIRVLGSVSGDNAELPGFGHLVDVMKTGSVGVIIAFTYGGFLLICPLLVIGFMGITLFGGYEGLGSYLLNGFVLSATLFGSIYLLLVPIVLSLYGRTQSFSAAYDVEQLYLLVRSREVITSILATITLTTAFLIGVIIVSMLTYGFGLILLPFALAWYMFVVAHYYGTSVDSVVKDE